MRQHFLSGKGMALQSCYGLCASAPTFGQGRAAGTAVMPRATHSIWVCANMVVSVYHTVWLW
jgi:hypothetical protein